MLSSARDGLALLAAKLFSLSFGFVISVALFTNFTSLRRMGFMSF